MEKHHIIPVWFFVGLMLGVYGILICASGIAEFAKPSNTVLADLHAPVWWGAVLIVFGAGFTIRFRPRKGSQ